jgi:hypothetical protein
VRLGVAFSAVLSLGETAAEVEFGWSIVNPFGPVVFCRAEVTLSACALADWMVSEVTGDEGSADAGDNDGVPARR